MRMHNPPHPGETLKEDVLPALGLTVTEASEQLGVSRVALSRVFERTGGDQRRNGDSAGAVAGGRPRGVAARPASIRLWHAEQHSTAKVKPAKAKRPAA